MPINITTAASPHVPNSPGQDSHPQYIFFDALSTSNHSQTFVVNQEPWYFQSFGLVDGDTVTVEMVSGTGSGTDFEPLKIISDTVQLLPTRDKLRLDWPGRYRLVYEGDNLGQFKVTGFPASMTHETTSDFSEALLTLINIFVNGLQTIHVTAPITISGAGSLVDPYVIGITAASNVEMQAAVSTNIINANNLSYFINSTFANTDFRAGIEAGNHSAGETCVGFQAGASPLVAAVDGTYVGYEAGKGMGPINGVVCVGRAAGRGAINADSVVFVGDFAGFGGTTSFNCVAVGRHALFAGRVTQGTFVGDSAGEQYAAAGPTNCSRATAIGYHAANNALSGSDCIFIGANAGLNETFTDVIVIGSANVAVNATANAQIILGTATQTQLVTAGSVISGGVIAPSDERLKTDIESFDNGLEAINMLRPVSFKWDEHALIKNDIPYLVKDVGGEQYGFVAQEIKDVLPHVINKVNRKDTDYLFIHYDRIIPFLVSAIQELTARLEALEDSQ